MISNIVSFIALGVAVVSAIAAVLSWIAADKSASVAEETLKSARKQFEESSDLARSMFKRQGVIDLHMAWKDVANIYPKDPNSLDIARAANALSLTATLWNHDVIERRILIESYWPEFQNIYDKLDAWNEIIEGLNRTGKDLLTPEIQRAYGEMKKEFLSSKTTSTKLPGG